MYTPVPVDETTAYYGARALANRLHLTLKYPGRRIVELKERHALPIWKRKLDHRPGFGWYSEEWILRDWLKKLSESQRLNMLGQRQFQAECKAKGLRPPRLKVKA